VSGSEHFPVVLHETKLVLDPASPLSPEEQLIEDLVYEHLFDLVDFDRMHQLEEVLIQNLINVARPIDGDEESESKAVDSAIERADAIVERAWHRLIKDERRHVDWGGAWEPDDDCPLCRALADADGAKPDIGGDGMGRARS
jgi:hypothetical protein